MKTFIFGAAMGTLNRRWDVNFFTDVRVDYSEFSSSKKVNWGFNSYGIGLYVYNDEDDGKVQFSFDGTNVHGELIIGTAKEAAIYDYRTHNTIWFRLAPGSNAVSVQIEAWRNIT